MSAVAPRIEVTPIEPLGPPLWETAIFASGIALLFGLVLALIVALPMRKYASGIARTGFARKATVRAALIEFVLLAGFSAYMRSWQYALHFLWEMHWLGWLLIGVSLLTVWLVAYALAPRPAPDTAVFD